MSWCSYGQCPSDCIESSCDCPCHEEDANSENSEEMEELCPYDECRKDCYGYSDDCNCPCHQDALEACCRAEDEAAAEAMTSELTALEENSAKEENSGDNKSK